MSKNWKKFAGVAAIVIGVMMFFSMMAGAALRNRARIVYAHELQAQTAQVDPSTPSTASPAAEVQQSYRHGHGNFHGYSSRSFGPLSFIGGLFRLAFFGVLGLFLLRLILGPRHHARMKRRFGPRANPVEDEIRVGDEINHDAETGNSVNTDDLTADDLILAMKRLGIKKLEL